MLYGTSKGSATTRNPWHRTRSERGNRVQECISLPIYLKPGGKHAYIAGKTSTSHIAQNNQAVQNILTPTHHSAVGVFSNRFSATMLIYSIAHVGIIRQ